MSLDKLLNKLCTIQTKTETQNATGSVTLSWADTYVSVPVRYNRISQGQGRVLSGSYQVTLQDYVFYFRNDAIISEGNRIVVDGRTFEVLHAYKDSSGHHWEVFARYITFE